MDAPLLTPTGRTSTLLLPCSRQSGEVGNILVSMLLLHTRRAVPRSSALHNAHRESYANHAKAPNASAAWSKGRRTAYAKQLLSPAQCPRARC